jgi:error-prone DNA polymerase
MYAELQVTTNFTFLTGASHPEELVQTASKLGYKAIGITDHNTLAGIVRAHMAAKEHNIQMLVGCCLNFSDQTPSILCYPQSRAAYGRLTRLLTRGKLRAPKGECFLYRQDLLDFCQEQTLIIVPPKQIDSGFESELLALKPALPHLYLALSWTFGARGKQRLNWVTELSKKHGVPLVITNDVLAHTPDRRQLQDILTCIREHCTIDTAGFKLQTNAERYLKDVSEMQRIFEAYPKALQNTLQIAKKCQFSLDELRYEYPAYPKAQETLESLTWAGAKERYPQGIPENVNKILHHELQLIQELEYAPYFLTVHEIIMFAKEKKILFQGRGSAANSAICYCLGITAVDPSKIDVLFERFLSKERNEPPDIDVDFEHERREEVIQFIYQRYGRDRAGIAATVLTYRTKSAIRDVGRALGINLEDIESLLKLNTRRSLDEFERIEFNRCEELFRLASELIGFPRHLGQHVGGFIITRGLLEELVPIGNAAMEDRTFIEWDKDDIESLKMLKVDVLGLGMLSCIRRCFELIKTHYGRNLSLATVPKEDPKVYDMLCQADTLGLFQVESRAQMSMLPRLKPRCYYDLVIEIALVRPGPIQGNMVHPYLKRRSGLEKVTYPSKELESVLGKTLGIPLFQEQAMKIAVVGAGFSAGQADSLRRAMATFKKTGQVNLFEGPFVQGMIKNGYEPEFAQQCFQQILGFADYGFPESHSASFALLVYISAWLKYYYPQVFACALLNSQPMGFYAPSQIISDAQRHGVRVLPIDVNDSAWDNILVNKALRLGLREISGISRLEADWIIACRSKGYANAEDLAYRSGISEATLRHLAAADAFGSFKLNRQQATWKIQGLDLKPLPLLELLSEPEESVILPHLSGLDEVILDYHKTGFSLKNHPIAFLRPKLQAKGYTKHSELKHGRSGQIVKVAGLVIIRQRPPTAKGMVFHTLEDETGFTNIVTSPDVCELYRQETLTASILAIEGKLQKRDGVIHVLAQRLAPLSYLPSYD